MILLGECSTGKSEMIRLLGCNRVKGTVSHSINYMEQDSYIDGFKLELRYVHPNGYSLAELYGDSRRNGVVNSLIKEAYEQL